MERGRAAAPAVRKRGGPGRGEYPIQGEELLKLLDLYGVSDLNQRSDLLQLGEDVAQRGWWDGYRPHLNANFADFVWMENNARKVASLNLATMSRRNGR